MQAVQPDMLAVHGYKWLISPNGAGFMYVSPHLREQLRPNVIGWRSHKDWRRVDSLHHGAPEFVESGREVRRRHAELPQPLRNGSIGGLMLELGPDRIEHRVLELADKCAQCAWRMQVARSSIAIPPSSPPGSKAAMRRRLPRSLKEQRIVVSARHGRLRVSTHFYNDESDIDRLRAALNGKLPSSINRGLVALANVLLHPATPAQECCSTPYRGGSRQD